MDSGSGNGSDMFDDLPPLLRVYKDGRVERLLESPRVPPSVDPHTGVESKDIIISSETGVTVRLFKPNLVQDPERKLPVLLYFHGGGFCAESTFSVVYHNYLNSLASQAQVLIVSVEYRLAPEHPLPAAYDDCWDALNWVISCGSSNEEPWLLDNVDLSRVFLAGDSAGGNITHHVALRVGNQGLANGSIHRINAIILFHAFMWGKERIGDEATKLKSLPHPEHLIDKLWAIVCPGTSGVDDPLANPANDPSLSRLGCEKVLVCVAEKDLARDRGYYYKEVLEKSGWKGKAEVFESPGEGHDFHLFDPSGKNAVDLMRKVVDFLNPAETDTIN